jgi:hypothetical protein
MAIAISFFRFQAGPKLEEVFRFQAGLQAGENLFALRQNVIFIDKICR